MSLLSRLLGPSDDNDRDAPVSLRAITARLEGLPPQRAHFLAAYAYLLARVAKADLHVDEVEVAAMERRVASLSDLAEEEASLVTRLALAQASEQGGTDNYLVTREFRKLSDRNDRLRLIRCLFAVAAADDSIEAAESREIYAIGEELGLVRSEVNGLRFEWRDKLAELQELPQEE